MKAGDLWGPSARFQKGPRPGLDRSASDRHGSLALALVGTGPVFGLLIRLNVAQTFWSHGGGFLWTKPGGEGGPGESTSSTRSSFSGL